MALKTISTKTRVSMTHQMMPSRAAIRYGVMVPHGFLSCSRWYQATSRRTGKSRFRSMWWDCLDCHSDCRRMQEDWRRSIPIDGIGSDVTNWLSKCARAGERKSRCQSRFRLSEQ